MKKYRFIPLLVASAVLLMAAECDKPRSVDEHVSAIINDVVYNSEIISYPSFYDYYNYYRPSISYYDDKQGGFSLSFRPELFASENFYFDLYVSDNKNIKLNKKYSFLSKSSIYYYYDIAEPIETSVGKISYKLVSGWMEFTNHTDEGLIGNFELDCVWDENLPSEDHVLRFGTSICLREGTFGPIDPLINGE